MAAGDLYGRGFAGLLRSADAGSRASSVTLDYVARHGAAGLRERLAAETVQFGLLRLNDYVESLERIDDDLQLIARSLAPSLERLLIAGDVGEVLVYGGRVFEAVRYRPRAASILKVPLRLHHQFNIRPVVPSRGMRSTVEHGRLERPMRQIHAASESLLRKLPSQANFGDTQSVRVYIGGGDFGGSGPPPLSLSLGTEPPGPDPSPRTPEPGRYTDLTLYEDHQYAADLKTATRLADDRPLIVGKPYTLEVAIRRKRTGIDADLEAPPVENPRKDKESLAVYVRAVPSWKRITIKETFAKIAWPYDKDSESAAFTLTVNELADDQRMSHGNIEVRLYDASLDLLDIVELFVTVVSGPEVADASPRKLRWPDKQSGTPRIEANAPPRSLSIHVAHRLGGGGYRLEFSFRRGKEQIVVSGTTSLTTGDLEDLLAKVRDFWTSLAITNYSDVLTVTRATFSKYLAELRVLGMDAWLMLFGSRHAALAGTTQAVGNLLAEMQLEEGTHIQITYDGEYGFIFPWSILYPPGGDASGPVDPLQFWGARFQIEQVTGGPKDDALGDEPVRVMFALDPGFDSSNSQTTLLQDYRAAAAGKLEVTEPVSTQQTLLSELAGNPAAHLCYFYCHGYASAAKAVVRRDGIQQLSERIDLIPAGSPERSALETLQSLLGRMGNESWLFIGQSEVRESTLKHRRDYFEQRRPIIFLNMCQGAELLPSMSSGLVRVFIDHNASAVVGTECPMSAVFANVFAKAVFDRLFANDDIGTALWKARRHFLRDDVRNPLGLAYTLYGRATPRLGSGPLVAAARD